MDFLPNYSFDDYPRILEPLYSKKDPAHGLLHDAHLCEGSDNFFAVKRLATASFRGYSLTESYQWVMENVINNRKRRCYTVAGKKEYARKLKRLKEMWAELGAILAP